MRKYYKVTKETIQKLKSNIKNSKVAENIKSAASSVDTEKVDEYVNNNENVYKKFDVFGGYVANKADKLLKKIGRKFKDSDAAKTTIAKYVSKIAKALCIVATIAFMVLVGYVLIKILPTIIMMMAFGFAVVLGMKFVLWAVSNAFNIETV